MYFTEIDFLPSERSIPVPWVLVVVVLEFGNLRLQYSEVVMNHFEVQSLSFSVLTLRVEVRC